MGNRTTRRWIIDSIQTRLTICLLTVLIPVLLVHSLSHYRQLERQVAQEIEMNQEVARAVARILEGYFHDVLRQEMAIGMSFMGRDPRSLQEAIQILDTCSRESPAVYSFSLIDPQGCVLASNVGALIGRNVSHRQYFQDIVAGKSWTVSNLITSLISDRALFIVARGIRDEQGKLLGIVSAAMLPEDLSQLVAIDRPGSGSLSVIDGEARTVYRNPAIDWTWREREYTRHYPVTWEGLQGKDISATVKGYFHEEERIVALSPIRGAGWAASASRPKKEVVAPILEEFVYQTGLILAAGIVALLVSMAALGNIVRPVKKLREYALTLGLDEIQEPIEIKGMIELEDLGRAFSRAAEQVRRRDQERIEYLERLKKLIEVSREVLAESTVHGLLSRICDTARELTRARLAVACHSVEPGAFEVASISCAGDAPPCSIGDRFDCDRGGLYHRLLKSPGTLRLSEEQLRSHPTFRKPPGTHIPLRGLVAGHLGGLNGRTTYILMASCKDEGDFTIIDETLLAQVVTIASLALKHIEAREDALKRASEIEAIMDHVPALVWIAKDPECRLITGSRASYELLRVSPGANVSYSMDEGRPISTVRHFRNGMELEPGELPLQVSASCGMALKDCELDLVFEDGTVHSLLGNSVPVRNDQGEVTGAVAAFADITELKHAGEEVKRSRDELEMRVKERTAELELANEKLRAVPARLIAVQEEERKRLASELHDSIGQTLAAIKFGIETVIAARDQGDTARAFEILDRFVPILQRSIDETRSIYMGLRPKTLEEMGLLLTLEWFCREFQKLYPGHHVELELRIEEEKIPDPLKITIFRIVQEALNNASKHSRAEWIDVTLQENGDGIELTISDDGVGVDLDYVLQTDTAKSLGLTGMRERAELSGGTLSLTSSPGEGMTIKGLWSQESTLSLCAFRD